MKELYFKFCNSLVMQVRTQNPFLARIFANYYASHRLTSPAAPQIIIDTLGSPFPAPEALRVDETYFVSPSSIYFQRRYKFARWIAQASFTTDSTLVLRISGNLASYYVFPFQTVVTAIKLAFLHHGWIPVHALGVCTPDGKTNILAGRSAVGKTILSVLAWKQGCDILSDDTVFIHASGMVCGFRQPIGIRFNYDIRKVLGLTLTIPERIIRFRNLLLKGITFGNVDFFLALPFARLFGSNLPSPSPLATIILGFQGSEAVLEKMNASDAYSCLKAIYLNENTELEKLLLIHATSFPEGFGSRLRALSQKTLTAAVAAASRLKAEIPYQITPENCLPLLKILCTSKEKA